MSGSTREPRGAPIIVAALSLFGILLVIPFYFNVAMMMRGATFGDGPTPESVPWVFGFGLPLAASIAGSIVSLSLRGDSAISRTVAITSFVGVMAQLVLFAPFTLFLGTFGDPA